MSTEPLNEDSYTYLDYSGVRIHHQNYNFGDQVVTQEDIVQKLESKAQDAE